MTVILPSRKERVNSSKGKSKVKVDKDGDADMNDSYNFDDYF